MQTIRGILNTLFVLTMLNDGFKEMFEKLIYMYIHLETNWIKLLSVAVRTQFDFLKKGKNNSQHIDVIVSYWLCVNCRWAGADFIDVLQWDEELRVQWGGTELDEEGRHQHTEEHAIHGPPIPLIQRHLRRLWGHQQGHRVSSRSLTKVRS